jgi:hypothetical protein
MTVFETVIGHGLIAMQLDAILAMTGVESASESKAARPPRPAPRLLPHSPSARPNAPSGMVGTKRKAEYLERTDSSDNSEVKKVRQDTPSSNQPYRGTGGLAQATKPSTTTKISKHSSAPSVQKHSTRANLPSSNGSQPKANQPTPTATPGKAPIKGSFQDIMNRAKALQQTKGPEETKYVNKRTEQRKREDRKTQLQRAGSKSASTSRSVSAEPTSFKARNGKLAGTGAPREKPKPEPLSYKGTARSTAPVSTYKGNAYRNSSKLVDKTAVSKPAHGRHEDYDEEDGYGDSEGYESSDMEADVHEVDEEEEAALREAKREDAIAKREEEELRRRKLHRQEIR